jgi:hypothetical protein
MPNYNESIVTGSEYTRCNTICITNPYGKTPSVQFGEERAAVLGADRVIFEPLGSISEAFDPAKVIPLLDPNTGLPTGVEATYGDVYIMIFSAYLAAAKARDAAAVP